MNKNKRTPDAGTSEVKQSNRSAKSGHLYLITYIMSFTTLFAGWHISNWKDAVIAILCGCVTIWLNYIVTGGVKE